MVENGFGYYEAYMPFEIHMNHWSFALKNIDILSEREKSAHNLFEFSVFCHCMCQRGKYFCRKLFLLVCVWVWDSWNELLASVSTLEQYLSFNVAWNIK